MNTDDFRRILTTFADSPADIDLGKGTLLVQVREEVIAASVAMREGDLFVTENDEEFSATRWLIRRIARLPLLADRILSMIPQQNTFVSPDGNLLDQIDETPSDNDQYCSDAAQSALTVLNRRPAGATSVLYLTSDAGEGKTTLINHLARLQAQQYKDRKTDWLLVPVSLGGRTFMRFDDVIVGALMNRFRFNLLFYDAFVELVRLGVVIPALDGFEEMFVEGTAGDAISALGNLMQAMRSSGTVMIAARKAYFEYKNLRTQTRLFDSLGGQAVTFSRLSLNRWNKARFLEFSEKRGVPNGKEIYDEVAAQLQADHPLLCRAVLVNRLLDIATHPDTRHQLLHRITCNPSDYFRQFIGSIIHREAQEKWIDKIGEPAQPLITEEEHYELLSHLAFEMWTSGNETLPSDVFTFITEMFADGKHKNATVTHQIVERVKQHALIVGGGAGRFGFDHPEFYHFFLGEAVGQLLVRGDVSGLRHAFRQGPMPALSMETAARYLARIRPEFASSVGTINAVLASEAKMSLVRENMSGTLVYLLDIAQVAGCTIEGGAFPADALRGRHFAKIGFVGSFFRRTSLEKTKLSEVVFSDCEFEGIEITDSSQITSASLRGCRIHSVVPRESDTTVFAPVAIEAALVRGGFTVTNATAENVVVPQQVQTDVEDAVKAVERLLRAFMRSPAGLNENTINQRLGSHAAIFFRDVYPQMESHGLISEMEYRGSGTQRRFRLLVRLDQLNTALEGCGGDFDEFIRLASQ